MLLRCEGVDLAAPEGKFATGGFSSDGGRLACCQRAASIPMEGDFRSDHSSRKTHDREPATQGSLPHLLKVILGDNGQSSRTRD